MEKELSNYRKSYGKRELHLYAAPEKLWNYFKKRVLRKLDFKAADNEKTF